MRYAWTPLFLLREGIFVMTGRDIVKALTESGLLDKEFESFEYDRPYGPEAIAVFEKSHERLENDEVKYTDINLIISEGGKWKLENEAWVG